jgi:hypothetical protein
MRVSLLILAIAATTAHAGTRVVLMTDPADASALQIALAGRGAEIATLPAPEGALRLDRAAVVQRSAVNAQAVAGVWIEAEPGGAEVCVVSSDGKLFRHAPLPLEDATPRVFAAIATSLLDEVLAPGDAPNVNVDVHVDIAPPGVLATASPLPAPPGIAVASAPLPETVVRANRTLLEIGPMVSLLTGGLEGELAMPIGEQTRAGVIVGIDALYDTTRLMPLYLGALELRHVGRGQKHTDIGLLGGLAVIDNSSNPFVGVRLEHVWEGPAHGISFSINPVLAYVSGSAYVTGSVYPGIWTSLRWELPI